jgi:hypothetical protein
VGAVAALLLLPAAGRAHGDPVSEVLLEQDVFLPLHMKPDSEAARELGAVVREAKEAGFQLKVAVIAEQSDLGPRFLLYNRPNSLAKFLATDVSARDGVLVVMPNGFGYATTIGPVATRLLQTLAGMRAPGRNAKEEAHAATTAVRRLAAARGDAIGPTTSGAASETRDRLIIAAAAIAAAALLAGGMLYRRRRRTLKA